MSKFARNELKPAVRTRKTEVLSIRLDWEICDPLKIPHSTDVESPEFTIEYDRRICLVVRRINNICRFYMHSGNNTYSNSLFFWEFRYYDSKAQEEFVIEGSGKFDKGNRLFICQLDLEFTLLCVDPILIVRFTLSVERYTHAFPLNNTEMESPDTTECRRQTIEQGTQTDKQKSSEADTDKFLRILSSDYEKLYVSKTYTDCVLKAGNTDFPVHRAVLAARSPVFAAMFHHDTTESVTGEANLQDVDATIFGDILHYLYSGRIRGLTSSTAASMFTVADKYALLDLRETCLEFLLKNLTIANICETALLSYTHGEEVLESRVVNFMDGNIKEVLKSDEWKEFSEAKPVIAGKFLSAAYLQRAK